MAERIVVKCQNFEELHGRDGFDVDKTAFIWIGGNAAIPWRRKA